MLRERHLAYSNPRPAPFLGPDERYVVLRFTPDKCGNPDGPGKYEVLVEDSGRNVIGWQYPMRFATEPEARAEANKIWVHLRKVNAELLARAEARKEAEKVERAAKMAAWDDALAQAQAADPGWDSLGCGEKYGRIQQIVKSAV